MAETGEPIPAELPENGRAQRLVDAGRVFGAVSRILQTAERLTPERLETALAITGAVAEVELRGLLESGGWQVPALEALPPDQEVAAMAQFLAAWHETLGTRALTTAELLDEIRAMDCTEGDCHPVNPTLAQAATQAMGDPEIWGVRDLVCRLRVWSMRIVNGLRLVREGKSRQGVRWRVCVVKTTVGPGRASAPAVAA